MAAEPPATLAAERTLRAVSAAIDGEGVMPEDLDADGVRFCDTAVRLRRSMRVAEAIVPPDQTAQVLARVARRPVRVERPAPAERPVGLVAGIAFLAAAVLTGLALAPGWRAGDGLAAADVGARIAQAQRAITAVDAEVVLVEQGAHPALPVRRYEGTLRYRAPEQLQLHLEDRSALPPGWPANDLDLVIGEGSLTTTGLRACPVAAQPACLTGPTTRSVVGVAPFAEDVVAPLDLVLPVSGLLPTAVGAGADPGLGAPDGALGAAPGQSVPGGMVEVVMTVARVQPLLDALAVTGALRPVHPSDVVVMRLDDVDLGLRSLSVRAAAGDGRVTWALANGYRDRPGDPLLDLTLTPTSPPSDDSAAPPSAAPPPVDAGPPDVDAGFVDDPSAAPVRPRAVPEGFALHRAGHLRAGGPLTEVVAYSDGRAWVRIDATASWGEPMLFGDLGSLVRALAVGTGTGYTTPEGDAVALHADGWDVVVTGSLPLPALVDVAASLADEGGAVAGLPLPTSWAQARLLTRLPAGALAPDGPLTAHQDAGGGIVVAVPGAGGSGARLVQRPGDVSAPPPKADVTEVVVRGVSGRWSAPLGLLTWAADGWVYELRSDGQDLDGLLAIADGLS